MPVTWIIDRLDFATAIALRSVQWSKLVPGLSA